MAYKKGESGNPGGRPKALAAWRKSDEAQRLRDLSYDALEQAVTADDVSWKDRIHAASILLDRIEGKPLQAITGDDAGAIEIKTSSGLMDVLAGIEANATR